MSFSISVPTSSVIAHLADDPFKVCVIEQTVKHKGRLTLVGGKVELPRQSHFACAIDEWDQEAGGLGATLSGVRLWAVKTDPYSDVRPSTLGKLTHDLCPEELRSTPCIGHYGTPDHIFTASVVGTPAPKDGEAKRCFFFDVRDLQIGADESESRFGAQHDIVLAIYLLHLLGRPVEREDMTDFKRLRSVLPAMFEAHGFKARK